MPRKAHKPTDQQRALVEAMAAYGIPQEDIGRVVGVSHPTLRKYYKKELANGAPKVNARVGKFLFHAATGDALKDEPAKLTGADCVRAAIFVAKTRMGYKESIRQELTDGDGNPLPPSVVVLPAPEPEPE